MYLEDPLLPVHLNEEPDLVDLTVSKHGNQKMLCIVSLSALFACSCGRSLSSPIRLASLKNFWRAEEWCRSGKREVIVS